jgi:hypothetical protein
MITATTTVDFIKLLTESINEKINEFRSDMRASHNITHKDNLLVEIEALGWDLGQINLLENKERRVEQSNFN